MIGSLLVSAGLIGCGQGSPVQGPPTMVSTLSGSVHSGTHVVSGASVQLYLAGTSGNGSAATALLSPAVSTDASGNFNVTQAFSCGSSTTANNQVYLVASGGNPGLSSGTVNPAMVLMAALGTCASLSASTVIYVNEVTTVAAVWALSPFMASASSLGASSTNAFGIQNAFVNASLLANTTTGTPAALASNLTAETAKLLTLANALAVCDGSSAGSACSALFAAATPTGSSAPADTLTAALNIAKHPGQNVAAIYAAAGANTTFTPALPTAPHDWTISLQVAGGGLNMPVALAVDAQGYVWVANQSGPLSAFNSQGKPLSATGFGVGSFVEAQDLIIDSTGNIWISSYNTTYRAAGSVTKFLGSGSSTPGTLVMNGTYNGFFDSSLNYPLGMSADTNGNIFIVNNSCCSATVYNSSGGVVSAALGSGTSLYAFPVAAAADSTHGVWLSDNDSTVAHISAAGALLNYVTCCSLTEGVATDAAGNLWVADFFGSAGGGGGVAEVRSDGHLLIDSRGTTSGAGGLNYPLQIAVDGAQNVWVSNYGGNSVTELAGAASPVGAGTALSPSATSSSKGGFGLDAGLNSPFSVAPDRSGSLWVANQGKNAVTVFLGLAAPTATPVQPVPVAP